MQSDVSICNMALYKVGHSQRINALDEDSIAAQLCNEMHPLCRDRLLEMFDWGFARKEVQLTEVGDEPTNWVYQYQYPSDCIKVRRILSTSSRSPVAAEKIPYEIRYNTVNEGQSICTDAEDAIIVYTARITNTRIFPLSFNHALSWLLAGELVSPLSLDPKYIALVQKNFPIALNEAITCDLNEQREDYPTSELISVRD